MYYVTMQITFLSRKLRNVKRNLHCDVVHITPNWISSLTLDYNGVFAIKAYVTINDCGRGGEGRGGEGREGREERGGEGRGGEGREGGRERGREEGGEGGRGGMTVIHIILMDHNISITMTSRIT